MCGLNLGTIRARVDRLAETLPDSTVMFLTWAGGNDTCAACGFDLRGHVQARGAAQRPDARLVWAWTGEVHECPECGAFIVHQGGEG